MKAGCESFTVFKRGVRGCHSHGFPALKQLTETYAGQDVVFAVIQTVFEGHESNGPEHRMIMAAEIRTRASLRAG